MVDFNFSRVVCEAPLIVLTGEWGNAFALHLSNSNAYMADMFCLDFVN